MGKKTYPKNPSVQAEALALSVHNVTVLEILGRGHEGSLVQVGVELLGLALDLLAGVEALEAVLLEGVHEDVLGHLETSNEVKQSLVLLSRGSVELIRGHGQQRAVKVINAVEEILSKALNSEVAGTVHIALCALLEVAEVGDGAQIFILEHETY